MECEGKKADACPVPAAGARISWPRLVLWLPAAAMLGAIAAWVAVLAEAYFAPWLIFPILVGVGLGGVLVGALRFGQIGHRPTIFAGILAAVAVAVVGQHYAAYHLTVVERRKLSEKALLRPEIPLGLGDRLVPAPPGFLEDLKQRAERGWHVRSHLVQGWEAWAMWDIDALLVLMAALAMAVPAARQPYCDGCRSWYRTVRSGRIGAAVAKRLAELAAMEIGTPARSGRFRLSSCHGGCGPTRLELSWEEADGRTFLNVAWLDRQQRDLVMHELDTDLR
jgi:hypothetical protein